MVITGRTRNKVAVWALTPGGKSLAERLVGQFPGWNLCLPRGLSPSPAGPHAFERLGPALERRFNTCDAHVFIMAAGIVVRLIAPLLKSKTSDPAVVVLDEGGGFAVALVSGHIGGANALAEEIAARVGARPVITTATDVNGLPAVDSTAVAKGWAIENPAAVKGVNMALIKGEPIALYDPLELLAGDALADFTIKVPCSEHLPQGKPAIVIDFRVVRRPASTLVLRPPVLIAGIGCNRGTTRAELQALMENTLALAALAPLSLAALASVDLKADEAGLLDLGRDLDLPIRFYRVQDLNRVSRITHTSAMAQKHIGANNVCEAAALLAADQGSLIVPKHKSTNATLALALTACTSWASDPEPPTTSP